MNRKNNPWVALVLMLALVICVCTGCADTANAEENTAGQTAETETARFIVEEASIEYADGTTLFSRIAIITDTHTGAQYIVFKGSNCAGMTVLEQTPETEAEG